MKSINRFLCFVAILSILIVNISEPKARDTYNIKIENIERIFYHEGADFTYWIRVGNTNKIVPKIFHRYWYGHEKTDIAIYDDLGSDEKMWAIEKGIGEPNGGIVSYIEIHVHSMREIEGGAWNHGKFGKGTTTLIE